jgi:ferredoxin
MKPKVDKEKCTGCGMCANLCSKTFKLGEDGKAEAINDCGSECDCQAAKNSCPVQAISLEE